MLSVEEYTLETCLSLKMHLYLVPHEYVMSFTMLFLRDLGIEKVSKARFFKTLFIYFLFCWVSTVALGFPFPVVVSRGRSPAAKQLLHCRGFSCRRERRTSGTGFSSCSLQALEHRLNSRGCSGLLFLGRWDFPRPGIERVSPCAGRWILTLSQQGNPKAGF